MYTWKSIREVTYRTNKKEVEREKDPGPPTPQKKLLKKYILKDEKKFGKNNNKGGGNLET